MWEVLWQNYTIFLLLNYTPKPISNNQIRISGRRYCHLPPLHSGEGIYRYSWYHLTEVTSEKENTFYIIMSNLVRKEEEQWTRVQRKCLVSGLTEYMSIGKKDRSKLQRFLSSFTLHGKTAATSITWAVITEWCCPEKVEAGLNLAANHAASVGGHSKFLLG